MDISRGARTVPHSPHAILGAHDMHRAHPAERFSFLKA